MMGDSDRCMNLKIKLYLYFSLIFDFLLGLLKKQVAPFRHGLLEHTSMKVSHLVPVKPGWHSQVYVHEFGCGIQLPLLKQGLLPILQKSTEF